MRARYAQSRQTLEGLQAAMGHYSEALDLLEDAFRRRDRRLTSLRTDAVWDPLRSDPCFATLVNCMRGPVFRPTRRSGL